MSNEQFKVKFGLTVGDAEATIDGTTGDIVTNGDLMLGGTNIDTGITGDATTGQIQIGKLTSLTNTRSAALTLQSTSTGIPTVGFGTGQLYSIQTGASTYVNGVAIAAYSTNITPGSEECAMNFQTMTAGALGTRFTIFGNGDANLGGDLVLEGGITLNGSTSGSSTFNAPATGSTLVYTLPGTSGAANTVLTNNGSGTLSWALPGGGGSTFGNITIAVADDNTISTTTGDLKLDSTTGIVEVVGDLTVRGRNIGTGANDNGIIIENFTTATSVPQNALNLISYSTGTPAVGFGTNLQFGVETAPNVVANAGVVQVEATDITPGAENFKMEFALSSTGALLTRMSLDHLGNLQIDGDLTVTGANINTGVDNTPIQIDRTTTTITNTAPITLALRATTSLTPAVGFGSTLEFEAQTAASTFKNAGYIGVSSTDITAASEDFSMLFGLMDAGNTYSNKMQLNSVGDLQIDGDLTVSGTNINTGVTDNIIQIDRTSTATNSAPRALILQSTTSNTPAIGMGTSLEFIGQTSASNFEQAGFISVNATDITAASEDFSMNFGLMTAGAAYATKLTIDSLGNLTPVGNFVKGVIRNATTEANGDVWSFSSGAGTGYRGLSVDNSTNTAKAPVTVLRGFTGGAVAGNGTTPTVLFERARGTSGAGVTAVQSGDFLGRIVATGANGNATFLGDTVSASPATLTFLAAETFASNTNVGTQMTVALMPTAKTLASVATPTVVLNITPQTTTSRSDSFAWANGNSVAVPNTTTKLDLDSTGKLIAYGNITALGTLTFNNELAINATSEILDTNTVAGTSVAIQTNYRAGFTSTGSSIAGTTLTIGTLVAGTIAVGQTLGGGPTSGTTITANVSGSGSGSTWTISGSSQTVPSSAIFGTGTLSVPQAGYQLGNFRFNSYSTTGGAYVLGAQVSAAATENWTSTANGSSINFFANKKLQSWTPSGSINVISASPETTIFQSDAFTFEDSAGTDYAVLDANTAKFSVPVTTELTTTTISEGTTYTPAATVDNNISVQINTLSGGTTVIDLINLTGNSRGASYNILLFNNTASGTPIQVKNTRINSNNLMAHTITTGSPRIIVNAFVVGDYATATYLDVA